MKHIKLYEDLQYDIPLGYQSIDKFRKELESLIDFLPDLYRKNRESWLHIIHQPTLGPRPEGLRYIGEDKFRELVQAGKALPYERKKFLDALYWALNPRDDRWVSSNIRTSSAEELAEWWGVSPTIAFMMKCMYLRKFVLNDMPKDDLDLWITETPTDMDLLSPEVRAGVLQRTGLKDISALARSMRKGLI